MATYTADLFMTLDGFGTGPVALWGKGGPEFAQHHFKTWFSGGEETLVLGGNTYRMMAHFAERMSAEPEFAALTQRDKIVVSTSLEAPLQWANTRLVAEDAVTAISKLKAQSPVPLRSHGSISLNRAALAAGLVDRLEVTVFPVITGASGSDPVLAGLPDIDLQLIDSRLFDGEIRQLVYVPTVRETPLGAS